MKKNYKDMTPEEQRKEDIKLIKRWSRQSKIISAAALVLSITAIVIRILHAMGRG